eukprot:TRINITY_DN16143_c0_g1_i3.p1 TRINITY_DN16143_c0_g1~~TRINITY_DN16143_c0_g1_i3.p1  ORF type:complete len:237 (+),score=65.86 TRINITY_DN16143_c0_g1_i3:100-810(+)
MCIRDSQRRVRESSTVGMADTTAPTEYGAPVPVNPFSQEDELSWDTRLRHLSSLCRHGTTAPVSFYGLRRVCGLAPMVREDYDIVRVEVRQLVESVDSIVRRLNETDNLLITGKKVEQDQIRQLANTFTSVKDELDGKHQALAVAARSNLELAQACESEAAEKLKAQANHQEALAAVNANHRIFAAMENEAINMRFDGEVKANRIIKAQMAELLEHQKAIAPVSYTHLTLPTKRIV